MANFSGSLSRKDRSTVKPFRNDLCQLVNFYQMSVWYQTLNHLMDIQVCVFTGLTLRADVDTSRES